MAWTKRGVRDGYGRAEQGMEAAIMEITAGAYSISSGIGSNLACETGGGTAVPSPTCSTSQHERSPTLDVLRQTPA